MYIIIDEEYRVYQSDVLTGRVRSWGRRGKISIIEVSKRVGMQALKLKGINRADHQVKFGGEWSEIQRLPSDFDPDPENVKE